MARPPEKERFDEGFVLRTRRARKTAGLTQDEMAEALGISKYTYPKYESRSPLPHYLVPRFLLLTGATADELFSTKKKTPPDRVKPDRWTAAR